MPQSPNGGKGFFNLRAMAKFTIENKEGEKITLEVSSYWFDEKYSDRLRKAIDTAPKDSFQSVINHVKKVMSNG